MVDVSDLGIYGINYGAVVDGSGILYVSIADALGSLGYGEENVAANETREFVFMGLVMPSTDWVITVETGH